MEYVGTREWVEQTLQSGAVPSTGAKRLSNTNIIRSAIVGQYPEVLEKQEDGQENNESSGS
jgi:hypothetical protein